MNHIGPDENPWVWRLMWTFNCFFTEGVMKEQTPSKPETRVVVLGGPDLSQSCGRKYTEGVLYFNAVTEFLGSLWLQWGNAVGSMCSFPTLSSVLHHATVLLVNAYCFAVEGGRSNNCRVAQNKCARWMWLHSLACYLATPNSMPFIFLSIDPQFGLEFSPIIHNWTQANYPAFCCPQTDW